MMKAESEGEEEGFPIESNIAPSKKLETRKRIQQPGNTAPTTEPAKQEESDDKYGHSHSKAGNRGPPLEIGTCCGFRIVKHRMGTRYGKQILFSVFDYRI